MDYRWRPPVFFVSDHLGERPEIWGGLLADTERHVANTIAENTSVDSAAELSTLRTAPENELGDPSVEHEDEFIEHRN